MALVFVVQNGAVKPVFVTSGMVIKDDTPAWQMNRGDLHQLTKSDLESILAIGGYGGRFVAHRDKKIEYVDFVERLWDRILATVADRNIVAQTAEAESEASEAESEETESEEDEASEDDADSLSNYLPQSYLDDPSDFCSDSEGEELIKVFVKDNHGQVRLEIKDVNTDITTAELKKMIVVKAQNMFPSTLTTDTFFLCVDTHRILHDGDFISEFIEGDKVFYVTMKLKLKGGAVRTIKTHLKQKDALNAMTKKSQNIILKKCDLEDETEGDVPQGLKALLEPIQTKLEQYRAKMAQGEVVINPALENLNDEQLSSMVAVLSKTSVVSSEEKIVQLAYLMLPELAMLDGCVPHIKKAKFNILATWTAVYGAEYSKERGSALSYDNDKLKEEVKGVQQYRRGIRRMATSYEAEPVLEPSSQSCAVM